MGKVKHQRRSARARLNPTQVATSASLSYGAAAQAADKKSEAVLPVITKLSAVDANERAWACACASNLVGQDHRTRKLLLSHGLVDRLIDRLTDTALPVAAEAAGALRNLTVTGGYKVCTDMFNKNIVTAMHRLVQLTLTTANEVLADAKPSDDEAAVRHRVVWSLAENMICIYWSLAETSPRILKQVTQPEVLSFVLRFIELNVKVPATLAVIAETQLNAIEDRLATMQLCLEILANMASEDTVNEAENGKEEEEEEEEEEEWEDVDEEDEDDEGEEGVPGIKKVNSDAVTTAEEIKELEAITNGHGDGDEEEEDGDDMAMVDAATGQSVHALEDAEARVGIMLNRDGGRFFSQRLLPLLVRLAEPALAPPDETVALALMYTRREIPAVAELAILHARALACLNNYLVLAAERSSHGWFAEYQSTDVPRLWHWLLDSVASRVQTAPPMPATAEAGQPRDTAEQEEMRQEILEGALDCLWSMARGLGASRIPATDAQIQALINVAQGQMNSSSDHLRANCVGILGVVAQRRPHYIEMNQTIGHLLMMLVTQLPQTPPETVVEALNALYDVYDDAAHDYDAPVFVKHNYLEALRGSVPAVRQMVKQVDRRQHPMLRERAEEALVNLRAFIEYKSGELAA
ncbi:armadillo-type protein [Syncephalis pseudoplumigaleata]|uniref:Armadillo-type protein n=1 Tax=Syncephalis pseudoplumigaleata TaxID=1712513 RepID=A0A4P9Z4Z3_9FUNG|nr:armadillo-type protein [Syncephalis pseudoplumigaleata]|eukprot:RKP27498.1 armadillo-type protein [Syncephalis pseudoplumigaleata]